MSFSFFFQKILGTFCMFSYFTMFIHRSPLYTISIFLKLILYVNLKGKFFNSKLNIYININLNSKILIH